MNHWLAEGKEILKKRKMKAIGKYIVITEIKEQQKTESGILLTSDDSNLLRYKKGLIKIPGTEVSVVSEGDVIYYDKKEKFWYVVFERINN